MTAENDYCENCILCGESTSPNDIGEMHDPRLHDGSLLPDELLVLEESVSSGVVHPECGLDRGWVIS